MGRILLRNNNKGAWVGIPVSSALKMHQILRKSIKKGSRSIASLIFYLVVMGGLEPPTSAL